MRQWCKETGEKLFVCQVANAIKGRQLTLRERYTLAAKAQTSGRRKRKDWAETEAIELARRMKLMVTTNLETDLDMTGGAWGAIVDIILHPDEPPIGKEPIVQLKHLPAYILKLSCTQARRMNGLEERALQVKPVAAKMKITIKSHQTGKMINTLRRR
jgi:hypothetical protein